MGGRFSKFLPETRFHMSRRASDGGAVQWLVFQEHFGMSSGGDLFVPKKYSSILNVSLKHFPLV